MQCGAVVNDDSNERKKFDGDEATIQVIMLVKEHQHYDVVGKRQMSPKAKESKYPPAPSRQLSPKVMQVGVLGIIWAMGDSHCMPESGCSLSQKNSISWCMI